MSFRQLSVRLSSVSAFGPLAMLPSAAAIVMTTAAPAAAQNSLPACERFPVGQETYACACPAGDDAGSVWGGGPYTSDSDVCTAARHQGVIGPDGGAVLALGMPGQEAYTGSEQNGVTSRDWGSYGSSYVFEPKGPRPMTAGLGLCERFDTTQEIVECSCPAGAGGSVWGSGPYTADSNICAAALHWGVIGAGGGDVRALRVAGLTAYRGSERNGVTTSDWGSYATSIAFDNN